MWHASRVKILKAFTKKILVLFKFEETFLKERGTDSTFVGHPLIDIAPDIDETLTGFDAPEISSIIDQQIETDEDDYDVLVDAMVEYPKLIERPVIFKDGQAIIGRPTSIIAKFLAS